MLPRLDYMRSMHSVCCLGDQAIIVTGSMVKHAANKAEIFWLKEGYENYWIELPELVAPRSTHASCSFKERFVYIFGGHV